MDIGSSAGRFQSRPSSILRLIRYATAIYSILVSIVLFYGLLQRETFFLFLVFAVMAPFGLLLTAVYRLLKGQVVRAKTLKLANVLETAAGHLDRIPRRLTKYDTDVSTKTGFVWRDAFDPFLPAVTRLLAQANYMIISEDLGRDRNWSTDTSPDSPPVILAARVKSIARAVRDQDLVAAFEAIGELLALPLFHNSQARQGQVGFTENDFVDLSRKIVGLLRDRKFLDAEDSVQELVISLREKGSTNVDEVKWRVLIAYWLWLRLSFLKEPSQPHPSWLWAGPSKLLAAQLDAALDAYMNQDLVSLSEIVNESFDWRTRVPRIIL